jgi:hypothetical protein
VDVTEKNGVIKTKLIKLLHNNNEVLVLLRFVPTKPEVQAEYLEHKGTRYNRWGEQGSFIQLINKCLMCNFRDEYGDRKKLLENIFNEKFEALVY